MGTGNRKNIRQASIHNEGKEKSRIDCGYSMGELCVHGRSATRKKQTSRGVAVRVGLESQPQPQAYKAVGVNGRNSRHTTKRFRPTRSEKRSGFEGAQGCQKSQMTNGPDVDCVSRARTGRPREKKKVIPGMRAGRESHFL